MTDGPVELFLAELARHLRGDEAARQRVVLELGDHLRDLVAEGRARGLGEGDAESEAVGQFGSPRALARALRLGRRRSRPLLAGAAVTAIAVACGGFAFAELRGTAAPRPAPRAAPAAMAGSGPVYAVDSLYLMQSGTTVTLDPHTGRVLACTPSAAGGGTNGACLLAGLPSAPFGQMPTLSMP